MSAVTVATYIRTTNDASGNPRRGWVVRRVVPGQQYAEGVAVFIPEGYEGTGTQSALRQAFPDAVIAFSLDVTPGEYRDRMKGAA